MNTRSGNGITSCREQSLSRLIPIAGIPIARCGSVTYHPTSASTVSGGSSCRFLPTTMQRNLRSTATRRSSPPDAVTSRLRSLTRTWREVGRMSDGQLAQLIHSDQVDILVDLSMHSGGSRLMVFAQKPAPLEMTYLGYAGTTGLHTIDYRLTDGYLDPPADPAPYVEKPLRLRSHWCYQPMDASLPVSSLPARSTGFVSFGCLNNFAKVNENVLHLWRRILQALPNSQLKLHAYEGPHRKRTTDFFAAAGISSDRIEFAGFVPAEQYLRQYNAIDIGLDPFPFAGATTTCDALYMGVPVVTMPGASPLSRAGVSVLSNAGFPELIARDPADYLGRAVALARDINALSRFRDSARSRLTGSALMDGVGFTRDVEAAFRQCWREWCAKT